MELPLSELIQTMLAPGIMISACGLLLLGTNNKYSLIVNRIRTLDDEKRRLKWQDREEEMSEKEQLRLKNIRLQLHLFHSRIKFVRNAVISYSFAVALFILTSLLIGVSKLISFDFRALALVFFLIGMLSVFFGSLYMAREIIWGYRIVSIEVDSV